MSTETTSAPAQTVESGTPGSSPTPVAPSVKSMVSDAYNKMNATVDAPAKPATAPVQPKGTEAKTASPKPDAKAAAPVAPAKTDAPSTPAADLMPEDKLEIPANASPEAVKNFKAYKESMKGILAKEREDRAKAEKTMAEYQAQIAVRTTASPAEVAETERLKTEHKAAMDRLAVLDLQNHPDFTRQYVEPKKNALALASEVLAYNGKEGVELNGILTKPLKDFNAAVSEFTKDMNSADASTVATALRDARAIQGKEQAALAQSGELRSQLQAKQAAEQKKSFDEVATEIGSSLTQKEAPDTFTPEQKEAVAKYNESLAGMRARAERRAFGQVSEREVATMAFKAEALDLMAQHVVPGLQEQVSSRDAVIKDLVAQIESLRGSRGPGTLSGDKTPGGDKPKTRQELLAAAYPNQRF